MVMLTARPRESGDPAQDDLDSRLRGNERKIGSPMQEAVGW